MYRVAGLLPSQPEADDLVEKLNHKINMLSPSARALAEKLLDALLEEDKPKTVNVGSFSLEVLKPILIDLAKQAAVSAIVAAPLLLR